jgi:hypothetical protein
MSTMIFVSLCIAGEGFLLYCLYHFRQELNKPSECECDVWTLVAPTTFPSRPADLQAKFAPVRTGLTTTGHEHAA